MKPAAQSLSSPLGISRVLMHRGVSSGWTKAPRLLGLFKRFPLPGKTTRAQHSRCTVPGPGCPSFPTYIKVGRRTAEGRLLNKEPARGFPAWSTYINRNGFAPSSVHDARKAAKKSLACKLVFSSSTRDNVFGEENPCSGAHLVCAETPGTTRSENRTPCRRGTRPAAARCPRGAGRPAGWLSRRATRERQAGGARRTACSARHTPLLPALGSHSLRALRDRAAAPADLCR